MNSVIRFKTSRRHERENHSSGLSYSQKELDLFSVLHYFNVYDFHLNVVIKKLLHMRRHEKM